jgi:hypothetical protein
MRPIQPKAGKSLEERLAVHPGMKERIERMLSVMENSSGNIEKANEAERQIFEELRQMGQTALTGWAERQHEKKGKELEAGGGVSRKEKKTSTGTAGLGKSK